MTIKVLFVDDCFGRPESDPRRQKIELLKELGGIAIDEVNAENLFEFKQARKSKTDVFDLIFVDYKLSTDASDIEGFSTGDQCESFVRAMCRDTPIYLLSVDVTRDKEFERPEGFERQVGETFLSNTQNVHTEISDHNKLRQVLESGDIVHLFTAMDCHDEFVRRDIARALPSRVRRRFNTNSISGPNSAPNSAPIVHGTKGARVEFYRWFIDFLYSYSGFLLDSNATANLLGMSPRYFSQKVESRINAARYKGIFSSTLENRWWIDQVKECVLDLDVNEVLLSNNLTEGAATIFEVPEKEKARCVSCNELWPDALGVVQDDAHRHLHPVHIRCSIPNPEVDLGAYFTSPRLIIDDESSSD